MAILTIFGEGRFKAIKKAARERRRWPHKWLADLDAAYSALLHHPLATDGQVLWYHEFLVWLGVNFRATRVLKKGLARFPDSAVLHETLRKHVLKDRGAVALEITPRRGPIEDDAQQAIAECFFEIVDHIPQYGILYGF